MTEVNSSWTDLPYFKAISVPQVSHSSLGRYFILCQDRGIWQERFFGLELQYVHLNKYPPERKTALTSKDVHRVRKHKPRQISFRTNKPILNKPTTTPTVCQLASFWSMYWGNQARTFLSNDWPRGKNGLDVVQLALCLEPRMFPRCVPYYGAYTSTNHASCNNIQSFPHSLGWHKLDHKLHA